MITLFIGQTANGTSNIFRLDADKTTRDSKDGERVIIPSGTFDGATVTLKVSADKTNFADITGGAMTTASAKKEYFPNELYVQATVSSAGASTDINLHIV